jgi:hypothetical protein
MSARSRVVITRASPPPCGVTGPQRPAGRSTKLTLRQEQAVIQDIFDLDRRGHALDIADVEFIGTSVRTAAYLQKANELPSKSLEVGTKWAQDFVDRTPELKTCLERNKTNHQDTARGLKLAPCWFKLLQETKVRYDISDDNIIALGETRFLINPLSIALATTPAQHQQRPNTRGREHHQWATVFQAISASGQVKQPMVIFKNEHFLGSWYKDFTTSDLLIYNSADGCNMLEVLEDWMMISNIYTRDCEAGTWRLLIQSSPKAGFAAEWDSFCRSSKIISVCVPPGSSDLLQPLELGCTAPLNTAFQKHIKILRQNRATSMTDNQFLIILKESLALAMTPENIAAGFQRSGIVPFEPRVVLPQLATLEDVTSWEAPKAPSPPAETYEAMIFCGSEFREIKAQIKAREKRE